jgi:hypothetical protein
VGRIAEAEPQSTGPERVDFLKQAIAFNEANIRAYDLKAQISLAAFVLSGNPLIAIVNGACAASAHRVLIIAVVVYVATILSFVWVLWPVAPPHERLTQGLDAKNLFYLRDPDATAGAAYATSLLALSVEPELIAELLKLSYIRIIKAQRFKNSLIAMLIAYLLILAAFFAVGRCAF